MTGDAEKIAKERVQGYLATLDRDQAYAVCAALLVAVDALMEIKNAYGSPEDEDFTTTEAREALAKIRGEDPK